MVPVNFIWVPLVEPKLIPGFIFVMLLLSRLQSQKADELGSQGKGNAMTLYNLHHLFVCI